MTPWLYVFLFCGAVYLVVAVRLAWMIVQAARTGKDPS